MNLIIQNNDVQPSDLEKIVGLSTASGIERIADNVFRLLDASYHPGIPELCTSAKLDYAFIPDGQRLSNIGLVVMDMDSTLITIECIDEIADMLNLKPQVSAITASAMRGEIDFAESLRRRVALLEGLEEGALLKVYEERLRLNPGAEKFIHKLQQLGIKILLVSGGFTFFTGRLKKLLNLDYTASNTLEIVDGKLTGKVLGTIIDAQGKADWLNRIREQHGLKKEQVIAIGDGANDLKMLAEAGISVAYHAKPIVREKTTYAINFVGLDGVLNLFENGI